MCVWYRGWKSYLSEVLLCHQKKKKKKIENGKVEGWKTNKNFLCLVDKKNERIEKIVWYELTIIIYNTTT